MPRQIVVIGGGPTAWEAARTATAHGARVTVISDGPLGGRAGWHSLLPSKVWLHVAEVYRTLTEGARQGVVGEGVRVEVAQVLAHLRHVAEEWNQARARALQALGVEVISGVGTFVSPHEVAVRTSDGEEKGRLKADAFIIATGSVPIFPPEMRPDGTHIIAPRFASHLERLPRTIVVVGGGPTGSEFAYLFNALGVEVTWIVDEQGVLPMFASPAGSVLQKALEARGVRVLAGQRAVRAERRAGGVTVTLANGQQVEAEMAFVAVGRRPDTARLGLEAAGVALREDGAIRVDAYTRTSVPHIFAAGDVTGKPMIANRGMAQAYVAGLTAAGIPAPPFRDETVVFAVYTEPQVAQVGRLQGEDIVSARVPFTASLKAHILEDAEAGFLELAYRQQDGVVVGGLAVGPHAADTLTPAAQAIALGVTVEQMASLFPAHPTLSELAFTAAREGYRYRNVG